MTRAIAFPAKMTLVHARAFIIREARTCGRDADQIIKYFLNLISISDLRTAI